MAARCIARQQEHYPRHRIFGRKRGAQIMLALLFLLSIFAAGFGAGYGAREYISVQRRKRSRKR
jgi:hypothetical protein